MNYLIQGVFFQNRSWLDTGIDQTGSVPIIKSGLVRTMFAGFIHPELSDFPEVFIGSTQDRYGFATLFNIAITGNEVRFTKCYDKHLEINTTRHYIQYSYKIKDGVTWVGHYVGEKAGDGISRCVLTSVDDSFFNPEVMMKLLGRDNAHKPTHEELE